MSDTYHCQIGQFELNISADKARRAPAPPPVLTDEARVRRDKLINAGFVPITGCYLGDLYHEFFSAGKGQIARIRFVRSGGTAPATSPRRGPRSRSTGTAARGRAVGVRQG